MNLSFPYEQIVYFSAWIAILAGIVTLFQRKRPFYRVWWFWTMLLGTPTFLIIGAFILLAVLGHTWDYTDNTIEHTGKYRITQVEGLFYYNEVVLYDNGTFILEYAQERHNGYYKEKGDSFFFFYSHPRGYQFFKPLWMIVDGDFCGQYYFDEVDSFEAACFYRLPQNPIDYGPSTPD